jgi:hypothetical protein
LVTWLYRTWAGGFAQSWYDVCESLGKWQDPTFPATIIP